VGLGPLAEEIDAIRAEAQCYGECARVVGWRD
jgi:hypothetical protein